MRHDKIPVRSFATKAWQNVYKNSRCLLSNRKHMNTPKRALHDVSNTELEESTTESELPKRKYA